MMARRSTSRSVASRHVPLKVSPLDRMGVTWKRTILAAEVVCLYLVVRLAIVGGPGAFPALGRPWVGPGVPSELKIFPDRGYDGQYVYRLAIDPFTTKAMDHGIRLDQPAYRQQRIMTALLGHAVSWCPGISIAVALIIVNAVAMVVAIVTGTKIAEDMGRRPSWGWLIGTPACLPASLAADLTEPVAWAGVLLALLAIRRGRWMWAAVAFTFAVLARETSALILAGFVAESLMLLFRGRWQPERSWLGVPIAIMAGWQLWLWHVWGSIPAVSGLHNTAAIGVRGATATSSDSRLPVIGIIEAFFAPGRAGRATDPVLAVSNVCERFVLAALIIAAGWALLTRIARPGFALTVSWALSAVLALSLSSWQTDIQFLRAAMEVWGLSVLVLLGIRDARWARWTLIAAASVAAWVAIYFLSRV